MPKKISVVKKATRSEVQATSSITEKCPIGTEIRFRAECDLDAMLFMHVIAPFAAQPWSIISEFDGVEVAFRLKDAISVRDLRWIASVISDAHVIVESLVTGEVYDGKRELDRKVDVFDSALTPSADVMAKAVLYARNFERFSGVLARAAKDTRRSYDDLYTSAGYPQSLLATR